MRTSREGRLLRLGLDRPEKRNALSAELCRDLVNALDAAASDAAVGAVLIEAEGPVFCSGMDLDEALSVNAKELTLIHERLFTFGAWYPKPVVASVQGAALGGGVGLAANAHIVVCSVNATFALPEIRIAMWPFVIWRSLVAALGQRRSIELALTGRTFGARDAVEWGLAHYENADAHEIAARLANASPETVARGLLLAREQRDDSGTLALSLRAELLASPDFHEGVRALRERRAPRWPSLEKTR